MILIKGLAADPTSNLHRSLGQGWTLTEHLMAGVLDEVRIANHFFAVANTAKGQEPPYSRPKYIERPGVTNPEENVKTVGKTTKTPEEVKAMLALYNPPSEE